MHAYTVVTVLCLRVICLGAALFSKCNLIMVIAIGLNKEFGILFHTAEVLEDLKQKHFVANDATYEDVVGNDMRV